MNENDNSEIAGSIGHVPSQQAFFKANPRYFAIHKALIQTKGHLFGKKFKYVPENEEQRWHANETPQDERDEIESSIRTKQTVDAMLRITVEDLHDVLLLAGNGRGLGAMRIIRGMYEQLVTAIFLSSRPTETLQFLEESAIQEQKILARWEQNAPGIADEALIDRIELAAASVREKKAPNQCVKCKRPLPERGALKTDLYSMALAVDRGLDQLYADCYLVPTAIHHATSLGLKLKLPSVAVVRPEQHPVPLEMWGKMSLTLAHLLLLKAMEFYNDYFRLGLEEELGERGREFASVWLPSTTAVGKNGGLAGTVEDAFAALEDISKGGV